MDKPTKGIPTVYKGVQFRSRMEARWAVMFDLLGWPWHYEPFDLEGWIPDFLLMGCSKVLVEVKPVVELPKEVAAELSATSWEGDILIVGCALAPDSGLYRNDPRIPLVGRRGRFDPMNIDYDPERFVHFPGLGFICRSDLTPCARCGSTRFYVVLGAVRCPGCLPPKAGADIRGWVDLVSRKISVRRHQSSEIPS